MILTGDTGGTKTLLSLQGNDGTIVFRGRVRQHDAFAELVACLGIAGAVLGERVKVTHLPWEIDSAALASRFGFATAAQGIDALTSADLVTLQGGEPIVQRPKLLIGADTGLGVAYVLGEMVLSGESGHATFAPADAQQTALCRWLQQRLGRVQGEHVVSGRGLVHIDEFVLQLGSEPQDGGVRARRSPPTSLHRRSPGGRSISTIRWRWRPSICSSVTARWPATTLLPCWRAAASTSPAASRQSCLID